MMSVASITERLRNAVDTEDARWWRVSVLSAITFAFCCAAAFRAVSSGHSYACLFLPVIYAGIWRGFYRCNQLLKSTRSESSTPALTKLSSALYGLAIGVNTAIILLGILF